MNSSDPINSPDSINSSDPINSSDTLNSSEKMEDANEDKKEEVLEKFDELDGLAWKQKNDWLENTFGSG